MSADTQKESLQKLDQDYNSLNSRYQTLYNEKQNQKPYTDKDNTIRLLACENERLKLEIDQKAERQKSDKLSSEKNTDTIKLLACENERLKSGNASEKNTDTIKMLACENERLRFELDSMAKQLIILKSEDHESLSNTVKLLVCENERLKIELDEYTVKRSGQNDQKQTVTTVRYMSSGINPPPYPEAKAIQTTDSLNHTGLYFTNQSKEIPSTMGNQLQSKITSSEYRHFGASNQVQADSHVRADSQGRSESREIRNTYKVQGRSQSPTQNDIRTRIFMNDNDGFRSSSSPKSEYRQIGASNQVQADSHIRADSQVRSESHEIRNAYKVQGTSQSPTQNDIRTRVFMNDNDGFRSSQSPKKREDSQTRTRQVGQVVRQERESRTRPAGHVIRQEEIKMRSISPTQTQQEWREMSNRKETHNTNPLTEVYNINSQKQSNIGMQDLSQERNILHDYNGLNSQKQSQVIVREHSQERNPLHQYSQFSTKQQTQVQYTNENRIIHGTAQMKEMTSSESNRITLKAGPSKNLLSTQIVQGK